ncbi:EAL domain-containing protein [Candidatus Methylobacter oryzae]|uniref:EAL domain-containing protein n=1 Tax=Candidatus Methylobacter oryzae TaxID=2497749 RepID=A0ABY3CG30_9GAMM|nr:EAL domain-containing protein [Candidatus Methylobacter oryzae]TRX02656.1 EAL domain-containing protein [Candidatus Methylobacter oryzae]
MMRTYAVLVTALICPCFSASAEPIHLQLRWHHQFQFAGYYAALEKGYYKDAGLDVVIHEGTPNNKPVQEVLQGHAQYGEANSELLLERLRGAPVVALAAIYQHSPSVLIVRKDAGIFSPDDLVGKKIMLMDQTVDTDFIAMFNNEGIDASLLHIIPSSYEISDLVNGKVDAFNSYLSNEPYFLKQQGIEFTVLNPRNYGVDFYSDILFTTEDELKRHPERVKAFRQASLEGWYYAMNHPQEIIDLLVNKYKVTKSRDHLNFEADTVRSLIMPDVIDLGHMNPWRWRHMAETFIKAGMVENDRLLQNFSYDSDSKADKEKLLGYIKIAVITALLTGAITLGLLASYRSLKRRNIVAARNEKLLRLSHETAGIGYYVIDLATGCWESSSLLDQILGIEAGFERKASNWATLIHPEYRQRALDRYQEIIRNQEPFSMEYEIIRSSDATTRWVSAHGDIEYDKLGKPTHLVVTIQDITERKQAEHQLTRQLRYLAIMERISRISSTNESLETMLDKVLREIKLIFKADRAWFLYPCDPNASFWSVPMEHTRPEWPGAFKRDMKIPVTKELAELFHEALEANETLQYGPTLEHSVPTMVADEFSVKSQLLAALRPQIGSPWLLGIHHCSEAYIHDSDDLRIFTELAQRITDTLSSLISLKSLRESEEHFRQLIQKSPVAIAIVNKQGGVDLLNDRFIESFGYTLNDTPTLEAWWPLAYPEQSYRDHVKEIWAAAMAKAIADGKEFTLTDFGVTCKDGTIRDIVFYNALVGERVLIFLDDITERKSVENKLRSRTDELALQNHILQLINQGVDLAKILDELAHQIEALHPNMLCSILLLDEDNQHLRHGAAPSLPDFYNQAIDGLTIGDGIGSCGTAAYRGESVIISDVANHPYCQPYLDLARLAGLQACWSHPIKNNQGNVLGTFAVYHRQPTQPTETQIKLIAHYAGLAQLAIEKNRSMSQIAESLSVLKATLESTDEAILAVDMNNKWLLHNQKFLDLWQIPNEAVAAEIGAEKLPYQSSHILDQLKDSEAFSNQVTKLHATPEAHSFDIIEFKNGKIIERFSVPKMINNKVVGRVWSFRDVTEQKQAEAELRIAATAFESQEGMSITDADQMILKVNKAFTRITGYGPEEVIGHTHSLLKSGRHDAHFYRALQYSLKKNGYWEGEIWNRRKNGEIYPQWLSITTVSDANNRITNYVAAFTDITKDKEAEETIHNLAYYDPLTALPNRRLLWERLKHGIKMERRDGKQLALLMLDLDRFKAVNDSMGHLAGDELLQQVAARIKARLRDADMVARLGGDEFVVLLENIAHAEDAARVAEHIVADLSQPFHLLKSNNVHPDLGRKVRIGASIGISLFPQHGNSPETLLDNADTALYRAKDEGRGCFAYFSEEFTTIARERIALETRLRHATEQRELCVYYQAQIDIDSGLIIGAEALVRWHDPTEGLISPANFIPIAEETGLIVEIGAWVLRETCRQGRRWIEAGLPPLTLAVNVSPHQFRRSNISALVAEVLHETGFPAKQLELELTESGLMENEEKAVEVLNSLRAQGVRLAIDDFGTGYSSLAYLKRFPLDVLKIDKSFIDDIPSVQDDMEITATIVAMGHILGFKVLAEGVETQEQLAFLRKKGCDTYQGYIKSKPLPADEFARLLREQMHANNLPGALANTVKT